MLQRPHRTSAHADRASSADTVPSVSVRRRHVSALLAVVALVVPLLLTAVAPAQAAPRCTWQRPCSVTLAVSAPSTLPVNSRDTIRGVLRDQYGRRLAYQVVGLWRKYYSLADAERFGFTANKFLLAGWTRTDSRGRFAFHPRRRIRGYYQVDVNLLPRYRPARTPAIKALVSYPTYQAPTVTSQLTSCKYVLTPGVNGAPDMVDLKAVWAMNYTGGVYQLDYRNGLWPQYHYAGQPWQDSAYVEDQGDYATIAASTYDPSYTPAVSRPGLPWSGGVTLPDIHDQVTIDQCMQVPSL